MKRGILFYIAVLTGFIILLSARPVHADGIDSAGIEKIDAQDSVVMDLNNARLNGNYIEIPVYINSDDKIYALDFSFNFNQGILTYDSLIIHTRNSEFLPLAYYNPDDKKLRFTSSTINAEMENKKPLVSLRFRFSSSVSCGTITSADILGLATMLNAARCSNKITSVAQIGIQANFTHNPVCAGDSARFFDASSTSGAGAITSWAWKFGSGKTSTGKNPVILYPGPGSYTVELIAVSNAGCRDTMVKKVSVNPLPNASFVHSSSCRDTVLFTDKSTVSSGSVNAWTWNFGDGATSNFQNPGHRYTATGNYTVSLVVRSDSGCTAVTTNTLTLSGLLSANFTAPAKACAGQPVMFTDSSTISPPGTITGWKWYFGDGNTSTLKNPSHSYLSSGTYTVSLKLTTSSAGCSDSIVKVISIETRPLVKFGSNIAAGCVPLPVNFTDSSTSAPGSAYLWRFGDGSTSSSPNVAYTYTAGGVYTVKLIVTTSSGCSDSLVKLSYIQADHAPQAGFAASNTCAGSAVVFTDTSKISGGSISSWTWSFGDGNTSSLQHPAHTYAATGTYTVSLNIRSDKNCTASLQRVITISARPVVKFGADLFSGCAPLRVNFTDSSAAPAGSTYRWEFGDGNSSTTRNAVHTYTLNGTFTVRHYVIAPGGCTDSLVKTSYINVSGKSLAGFTTGAGCLGSPLTFTNTSVVPPGSTPLWSWSFGDGSTSAQQSPSHTYASAGTYTVTLKVADGNCSDSLKKIITVDAKPQVKFGANLLAGCRPLLVSFTDSSSAPAGSTFRWSFGDGNSSTARNAIHTYTLDGSYTVRLYVTTPGGCADSLVKTSYINVSGKTFAGFAAVNVCTGSPVAFTNTSTIPPGSTPVWFWDFGDGNSSIQRNPLYIYGAAGTYTVTLRVTDKSCTDSLKKVITIENKPVVRFGGDAPFGCLPHTVGFYDSSLTAAGSAFRWIFSPTDTSVTRNSAFTYTATGLYTVKHYVTTPAGCTDSLIKTSYIKVLDSPLASFSISPQSVRLPNPVNFTNLSRGYDSGMWNFGDSSYSSLKSPTHSYQQTGTYTVCLAVKNAGCTASVCDTISVRSPNVVAIPKAFSPNGDGANDVLKVRGGPMDEMDFRIFNEWGIEVFYSNRQSAGWDGTYREVHQPVGVYVYTLTGKTTDDMNIKMHGTVTLIR